MAAYQEIEPLWPNMKYFPHQVHGIRWMLEREVVGTPLPDEGVIRGGFQCDDMGLGKTIQTTAVICHNPLPRTLLVVPVAMVETWVEVCCRAGILVFEVSGKVGNSGWSSRNFRDASRNVAVYVTNFEKIPNRPSLFGRKWDRIVVDEAHKLRNPYAILTYAMRQLQANIRWVLTGTPLVNSMRDVASLAIFLGIPYQTGYHWSKEMKTMIPHMMIHRTLDELRYRAADGRLGDLSGVPPLPDIEECVLPFATEAEEKFYHGVQGAIEDELSGYYRQELTNAHKFLLLLRLRQISVHPQTYILAKRREQMENGAPSAVRDAKAAMEHAPLDWTAPSTKMLKVAEIMHADREAEEPGGAAAVEASREDAAPHKYLIFCQFHDEMTLFQDFLVTEGLVRPEAVLLYHGGLSATQRKSVLAASKSLQETTVLLVQLQAGGVGLNLQEYDRMIFMSPWWTAALMDQAMARSVRMGQKETVRVYHLRLAAEKENSVDIDRLVHGTAETKRGMLDDMFQWCAEEAPEGCAMESSTALWESSTALWEPPSFAGSADLSEDPDEE